MGTYATTTSLNTLMVGYTFDSATTSIASKCITWAENEIDKKLARRYDVSAFKTTTPPLITSLCETLALGYLYENVSRGSKESISRAQIMIKRVIENLDELAAGSADVVDSSGDVVADLSGANAVRCNTSDYAPTFAEDDPLKWRVDSDKLDDIKSDRD